MKRLNIVQMVLMFALLFIGRCAARAADDFGAYSLRAAMKPEVIELLRQATAAYHKLQTYQHTEVCPPHMPGQTATRHTLILERPNRFAYHSDDPNANGDTAVCDGKTLTVLRRWPFAKPLPECLKTAAPASFDDVDFVVGHKNYNYGYISLGVYPTLLIAHMLRGDALENTECLFMLGMTVRGTAVGPNGQKFDTIVRAVGGQVTTLFFDATTHLLVKSESIDPPYLRNGNNSPYTVTIQDVVTDGKIDPNAFNYSPPADVRIVDRFNEPADKDEADRAAKMVRKFAPNAIFKARNGKDVSLASLTDGKFTFLYFWCSWWRPCERMLRLVQELNEKLTPKGWKVITVDEEDTQEQRDFFLREHPAFTFPVLIDTAEAGSMAMAPVKLFGGPGATLALIIDPNGMIRKFYLSEHDRAFFVRELEQLGFPLDGK